MPLNSILVVLGLVAVKALLALDSEIKINSLGYMPNAAKRAYVSASANQFNLLEAGSGNSVYEGTVGPAVNQSDVGQTVHPVDFSDFNTPGEYILEVPGVGRSIPFKIDNSIYQEPYQTAMRAFYLWRCGTAVSGDYKGERFQAQACHLSDGDLEYVTGNGRKDGTQGWHDAGDYGKYTVNAGVTLGNLLWAWQLYGESLEEIPLNLPETNPNLPEFLKEIKWETDWLLKMSYPDGSGKVSHKLTRLNFSAFIMPEEDRETRYFTDWSSAATASFAAALAMASRSFRPYLPAYADSCLSAAKRSYNFLAANPGNKNADLADFSTGGYQTQDGDDRTWMAAELWEATGEPDFLTDFENRASSSNSKVDGIWDWGNVKNLGMFSYVLSTREGRNNGLLEDIKQEILDEADNLVNIANSDAYGRSLGKSYNWGCNGSLMRQALTLDIANKISPKAEYNATILSSLAHVFGANYYGRSYITGIGHEPPMRPHDRRSGADGTNNPWPGYIVGGGHSATDWVDEEESYETNEIAINWQAALVFALAKYASGEPNSSIKSHKKYLGNNQINFRATGESFFYKNGILPQNPNFKLNGQKLRVYKGKLYLNQ